MLKHTFKLNSNTTTTNNNNNNNNNNDNNNDNNSKSVWTAQNPAGSFKARLNTNI